MQIKNNNRGFTLVELVVTVAILAVLTTIAMGSYSSSVTKTRRSDAYAVLSAVSQKQEQYYSLNSTYVVALTSLGYAEDTVDSDEGYYLVSAAACGSGIGSCVTLTAAPMGSQANDTECGSLTLASTGLKGETGTLTAADCWK